MAKACTDLRYSLTGAFRSALAEENDTEILGGLDKSPGLLEADRRRRLHGQLMAVAMEAPEDDEDIAPSFSALATAGAIVNSLPAWVEEPEIDADGRGGVMFEWYRNPTSVAVVTTDGATVTWAALSGSTVARSSGSDFFVDTLPEEPLRILRRQRA